MKNKELENILTNTLDKLSTTYTIDKAMEICDNHLLFMKGCKDKRQMIVFTLADNLDYCEDLISYYYGNGIDEDFKTNDVYYLNQFRETLAHDLLGLYNKDEHFVPRISNSTD